MASSTGAPRKDSLALGNKFQELKNERASNMAKVTPSVVISKDRVIITMPREDGLTAKNNKRFTPSGFQQVGVHDGKKLYCSVTVVEGKKAA